MSESCGVGSNVDCPFVRYYGWLEDEKNLSPFEQRLDVQPLPVLGLLHVVVRLPFIHLYFAKHFQ